MFRFFGDELMEHVIRKRCPAKRCAGLIRYEVLHQSSALATAAEICPTDAIRKDDRGQYRIDQEKCVKCDACREQAPYAITVADEFSG
jgi:dissimilatory sulfite reductase (desulfoviridin) alpha/beta subunit